MQGAFEALRKAYDRGCADPTSGFLFSASAAQSAERELPAGPESNIPSWDFYAEAAEEAVPMYRVERAKSARSHCQAKGSAQASQCSRDDLISKDELRVGWLNSESGTYGGWVHLGCWRVPNRVWLGLPDPIKCSDVGAFQSALRGMGSVLLSGLAELSGSEMRKLAHVCLNRANWARRVELKDRLVAAPSGGAAATATAMAKATGTAQGQGRSSAPAGSNSSKPSSGRSIVPATAALKLCGPKICGQC